MNSLSSERSGRWTRLTNEWTLVAAILIVVAATAALDGNHSYLKRPGDSVRDIARNTALLGIFALGASVVIISGGIDLSSGSVIAFSGTVCALLMLVLAPERFNAQRPVGVAVVATAMGGAVVVGFLVGTLHAWLITAVRLPPFVATLATLVGLRSLARALCESVTSTVINAKNSQVYVNDPIFKYLRDNVWVSVTVFAALALFTWIVLTRTVLGRHIYALGGNEQAARLSGIRTENVKWVAYCFGAITASIAGIFYVANESVAAPVNQGRGHELNAIAAAVVGGCSLQGGIGTVPGTVLGAIFLRVVIDAVAKIIKTGADVYEGLIVGAVVVLAVTFSQLRQLVASGRQLLPGTLGLCAIPTLTLLVGAVGIMTLGRSGGLTAGFAALALLLGLKIWENARVRRP